MTLVTVEKKQTGIEAVLGSNKFLVETHKDTGQIHVLPLTVGEKPITIPRGSVLHMEAF